MTRAKRLAGKPARTPRSWPKPVQRFLRNTPAVIGLAVLLLFCVLALLAPWISPYGPAQASFDSLSQPPSVTHRFGTDDLGRDLLTRTLFGARISLTAGIVSVLLATLVGTTLGLIAGFFRGWVDEAIMRLVDALLALPFLVLAIALAAVLGPSLQNAMLAIAIVTAPTFARITRGEVLAQREREYVQAATALGATAPRIILRHLLPNIMSALIVQVTLAIATAVLAESTLSFLGLGVQPPTPSWGAMLDSARGFLASSPWMAFFPGTAIFLTVLAFNLVGDGLREALDPRQRH
ncbi:ABC transporter permease [Deinococcus yavapaiensis]|uniref:Peptide/nickel transport system permease protein n=1 Tax=Deinococcus yavapaiensis KR-236 TaxID=694435 RepID=A0A318S066_9DEIO|nr:ABC transporter permease [Deinococcus yavapaiensis]PYE50385.1 peptide/nickel transport system permease protein [Deinococcus yavapaiensis KR-236]